MILIEILVIGQNDGKKNYNTEPLIENQTISKIVNTFDELIIKILNLIIKKNITANLDKQSKINKFNY